MDVWRKTFTLFFTFISLFAKSNGQIISSNFNTVTFPICDVSERIDRTCSWREPKARSLIHCMSLCSTAELCKGASVDENGVCFLHKECPVIPKCTVENTNHQYFSKSKLCAHGTWDKDTQSCTCNPAFRGERCDRGFGGCKDLISSGYTNGFHRVYIDPEGDGKNLFPVVCIINQNGYSASVILHNNGRGNFNRTWEEYVQGFYDDNFQIWIGLDNLQKLLNSKQCDRTIFGYRVDRSFLKRDYNGLSLSKAKENYKLGFSSVSRAKVIRGPVGGNSSFGDCLTALKTKRFSTWDRDNDEVDEMNCAARNGMGWWYGDSCDYQCKPLGLGFDSWDSRPSRELWSLTGLNMDDLKNRGDGFFKWVIEC